MSEQYLNLIKLAQSGALETSTVKAMRAVEAITAEQAENLNDIRKDVKRGQREVERDADYDDLRGVVARNGLGGLVSKVPTGEIVFSHGGHTAVFSGGNAKKLAPLFRAIMACQADQEQDSDEESDAPPSLSAVG